MAQLEVNFTITGEKSETTFKLIKNEEEFRLKGYSEFSGEKVFSVGKNKDDSTFVLKDSTAFSENDDVVEERLQGLFEEYVAVLSEGWELDDDVQPNLTKPGYGPDDIYVENKPFSINTIMEMINDGDLEVAPDFQRHFVWDKTRQSKLIESILLGLPLPSIYLSQYPDGILTIVDGLQRITTIRRFMKDELTLCNLEYFTDCNDKTYSELKNVLPLLQYRRFRQTQIMCFVIDYRSPNALKFDLFRRLNTGGKALNDQEIRNCLSRRNLQNLLSKMVETDEFKRATNESLKDTRMAAQESALRFIYFYEQYSDSNPVGDYNGEIRDRLDDYVETLNNLSIDELKPYIEIFRKSMRMSYELFGDNAFRKIDLSGRKKFTINRPLMLAVSVLLARHSDDYMDKVSEGVDLTDELGHLLAADTRLTKVITTSTMHRASIKYTFETLKKDLFDKYLLK